MSEHFLPLSQTSGSVVCRRGGGCVCGVGWGGVGERLRLRVCPLHTFIHRNYVTIFFFAPSSPQAWITGDPLARQLYRMWPEPAETTPPSRVASSSPRIVQEAIFTAVQSGSHYDTETNKQKNLNKTLENERIEKKKHSGHWSISCLGMFVERCGAKLGGWGHAACCVCCGNTRAGEHVLRYEQGGGAPPPRGAALWHTGVSAVGLVWETTGRDESVDRTEPQGPGGEGVKPTL